VCNAISRLVFVTNTLCQQAKKQLSGGIEMTTREETIYKKISKRRLFWQKLQRRKVRAVLLIVMVLAIAFEAVATFVPEILNNIPQQALLTLFFTTIVALLIEIEVHTSNAIEEKINELKSYTKADLSQLSKDVNSGVSSEIATILTSVQTLYEHNTSLRSFKGPFEFEKGFDNIIDHAIREDKKVKSLYVFAQTGNTYWGAVRHRRADIGTLENCKLVLANADVLKSNNLDAVDPKMWTTLKDSRGRNLIKKVVSEECQYLPIIHFAIVNEKYLFFGIYKRPEDIATNDSYTGEDRLYDVYNIVGDDLISRFLKENFHNFFKSYFPEKI